MENSGHLSSQPCQQTDIQINLSKKLDELRQRSPERFPTPVYVLATVDDTVYGEAEERFMEASKCYSGKRIMLIPYNLGNSHWAGILIEFNSTQQIERSKFIDPLKGSDFIPDALQEQFIKVFPKSILRAKTLLKHEDQTKSAMLTMANLLNAVQNLDLKQPQSNTNSSTFLIDEEQTNRQKHQYSFPTHALIIDNEGNQSNLQELEKNLSSGLARLKISDEKILLERIRRTKDRIEEYRAVGRTEDAKKEMNYLREYELQLHELPEKISVEKSDVSENSDELEISQLENKITDYLGKLKIPDLKSLSERITRSEQRIEEYQEEGRSEELEKEQKFLSECKILQKLAEDVRIRQSADNNSEKRKRLKLSQLEQRLSSSLANLKISDATKLPDRIIRSEQRMMEYQDEGRVEEVEKEQKYLIECRTLQKLTEEIHNMKLDVSESRLDELEQKLANNLVKLKFSDVSVLPEKIRRSEQRINEYKEEGRAEEAEKEMQYLSELHELKALMEEISSLKLTTFNAPTDNVSKLRKLEEKLASDLVKLKFPDVSVLPEKIRRSEQRINEYKEEGRAEEAEKEMQYLSELHELKALVEKISSLKLTTANAPIDNISQLRKLEEKLAGGLVKLKFPDVSVLPEKIRRSEQRINEYKEEGRRSEADKEQQYLTDLKALTALVDQIKSLKPSTSNTNVSDLSSSTISRQENPESTVSAKNNSEKKKLDDLDILHRDWTSMHSCAEKTVMQLLEHFQRIYIQGNHISHNQVSSTETLNQLQHQIQKQELFSENIQENLQDLERYVSSRNIPLIVRCLAELLTKIRPLDVLEIHRLVKKAKDAAKKIAGKEIILLIGETGTGKSTTIQFLTGSKMKKTRVEVEPGKFLEHITVDGPVTNSDLINVTSSALSKSETRFIAPVTIQLKDIFGSYEFGEIIVCDAPGFGDTAGPEVDIANGVGVIEAIKGCKSVKILALSSFKSLGDRGQGIQKLAHLLINMVHGIQDRLSAIFYAFTKYPPNIDISALLIDIKISKVDTDPLLRSDSAFVTVLTDMINKTKDGAENIDPIHGDPKNIIKKLKSLRGIMYPVEVFRFSISPETQACIVNQLQKDNLGVKCALKHKDIDVVMNELDKLKTLKDLLEVSTVRDTYDEAIRSVNESITVFFTEVTKKFNRALASQDGLRKEDIDEYNSSIKYIEEIQKLTPHLGASLLSPESLMQNIHSELQKRSQTLIDEDLHSPLIGIFFNNLLMLKNYFEQIESFYSKICKNFEERFDKLVESAREPISANELDKVADIILKISKCIPILNKHLHGLVEEKYESVVQSLLQNLTSFLEKADSYLAKMKLTENELEIVKDCVKTLRIAKGNVALQDRVATYVDMLKKKNDKLVENVKSLSEIYNELIQKILNYFDQINNRIAKLFQASGDRALEDTETLVNDMDAIRGIPEIESKTAGAYYRTVENIRGHMHQLQRDVEQLLSSFDLQLGTPNYGKIARLLSSLKNAKWMNRVSPGAYDASINRVTEELTQYFHELEDRLMKLDLSLKYPENVCVAQEIFDKIESLSVLERSVPELKNSKETMIHRFLDSVQGNFNRMQTKFHLQDVNVYQMKQELNELQQIKREFDNLHSAHVFLRKHNYSNIDKLNHEIDELEKKQEIELTQQNEKKSKIESELNSLKPSIQENGSSCNSKVDENGTKEEQKTDNHLNSVANSRIDAKHESILKLEERLNDQLEIIQEIQTKYHNSLAPLKSIKQEYESLIAKHDSISDEQIKILQDKGQDSIETLNDTISKKKKIIVESQKSKQSYDFDNRFDAATADVALLYTSYCEKIANIRFREIAADTYEILMKYIKEYGIFLDKEIERLYKYLTAIGSHEDLSQHSQDLETRLEQLSSLNEFKRVFECIEGTKKVEYWRRKFGDQYRSINAKIEEYKLSGRNDELRKQLNIAQGLMSVDQFCGGTFLSHGFGASYRDNQVEVTKQSKEAYKVVLESISREDYAGTDNAMADIDDSKASPKDVEQIKQNLQTSLNQLMIRIRKLANSLDLKIDFKTNSEAPIQEINANIDKIRTALSKSRITGLIDEKIKSDLTKFEETIRECLLKVLLSGIESIKQYMSNNDVLEAELSMENLILAQRELDTGHFDMTEILEKMQEVKKRLESLANDISTRNDFKNIDKYPEHSPKDLLIKLKKATSYRSARYEKVHTFIVAEIQRNFETAINNACEAPIEKRSAQIVPLHYALNFLPEDLQKLFEPRIIELKNKFLEDEHVFKRDLKIYQGDKNLDDSAIEKIGKLAMQYEKEKRDEPLGILRSAVLQKVESHWKSVQNAFDKEDALSAISSIRQIIKYADHASSISEVEKFYKYVCETIAKCILCYTETLNNVFEIEKIQTVEIAFTNLILFIEFSQEYPARVDQLIPEKVLQNVDINLRNMFENWQEVISTYVVALKDLNIKALREVFNKTECRDGILQKIQNCSCKNKSIQLFAKNMKSITLYSEMISEFKKKIVDLAKHFDGKLISDETTRFEAARDAFFSKLTVSFKTLKQISSEFNNVLSSILDINTIESELKLKVKEMEQKLLAYTSRAEYSSSESDQFRMYYNHLVSFGKYTPFPDVQIQQSLELAENNIFEKIISLSKEIPTLGSDFDKVANLLMKMKFFAENFSMFDTKINQVIDESLKSLKSCHGSAIIGQLTMVLERSEIGSRLMSEHSTLSGEDWRKRREKMQKQDDLEYVLQELTGDEIAKDTLRTRYGDFRRKYDDLISKNLTSFNPKTETEPKLDVLISETKRLIAAGTQKADQITLDHSFQDKIPELLAHIFAVWTLKNTQHYNAMRGIEAGRAYLLMPHVAQVISIFRVLGIGYTKDAKVMGVKVPFLKRISHNLVNNLVEIGTGEGKSVVLAVTACVFALIGVDVNCSCYSEYLSMRDKNDFAPVFRELGVEERIEYGTFNKLCENFLNEQCNLRETVRDMVMENKNTTEVVKKNTRSRPKFLLIDEVDVFLSEKFYGGMYTPSVYLKDPVIKTLLDTLWQNRNLRTLNAVKALPAYKNCVTRFSNWTFLLDEAIKDMMAALQTFLSSTYVVQNDRIVYVEGESLAENVIRGYHTIWAYYHEHQNGFISEKSLETNVGIIINCGTFSYAQMPKEFAYITGVSGTLRTLAEPEKKILQEVYGISKNTYMPSVFGKSNRNYNPISDVEAIETAEFFMRIRGEIDTICNAQRAILVFFDSEESLLAFYDSQQLSSIKQNVQIITERVSAKDRELCIKRAATDGRVTLLTRTFGRGTDFICRNQQVLANGGIHVLQTFFSKELSEEYQIMGRGARQGDRGSYRMVLVDSDLEWVIGANWENEVKKIKGSTLYESLNEARNKLYDSNCAGKKFGIEQCKPGHEASKGFMDALIVQNMEIVKHFLVEQNRGPNIASGTSRTVLLMDATGSMSSLLSATKETVCTMFERASAVLGEKGLPIDAFSMQFAVYRNYNSKENKILEVSGWETKGNNLRTFMNAISSEGGMGEEAIEIGLWHSVKESETQESISQVILIGDAPANTKHNVAKKRAGYGEAYWKQTRFATPTYYADELQKLKSKKIPVHTFYLTKYAAGNFQEIANETKGRCESLDIYSPSGIASLTNYVTEEVLRKAAGDQGDAAVELYRKKYSKTSFTS